MDSLTVARPYQAVFTELGLHSARAVLEWFDPRGASSTSTVSVTPGRLPGSDAASSAVFFKLYHYRSPSWRFIGRRSKAGREFENYAVLEHLGIPCAERIACGEERDGLGRLKRAFIITRAIANAGTLIEFVDRFCPSRATVEARALRRKLLRQLAELTRRIHAAGFFHRDLVWRNVLVEYEPPAEPRLWWIDCPRGRFDRWSPWRTRRRLKDLASLDKAAQSRCTRGERLEFLKVYLATERLNADVKRLARATWRYGQRRWPEG